MAGFGINKSKAVQSTADCSCWTKKNITVVQVSRSFRERRRNFVTIGCSERSNFAWVEGRVTIKMLNGNVWLCCQGDGFMEFGIA